MVAIALDAWPLAGYVFGEACTGQVIERLERAQRGEFVLAITAVNWGEVVYDIVRRSAKEAEVAVADLDRLPIEVVPVSRDLTIVAARLKAERGLDYADSLAAALALALDAPLMTGDPHFRELLPELPLEWVGE